MKPSELQEEQWIKISDDTGTGAIGFHVYYSTLYCFAINHDLPADNIELGIQITNDPATADKIYEYWLDKPGIMITRSC